MNKALKLASIPIIIVAVLAFYNLINYLLSAANTTMNLLGVVAISVVVLIVFLIINYKTKKQDEKNNSNH